jgi:hypothetical protein
MMLCPLFSVSAKWHPKASGANVRKGYAKEAMALWDPAGSPQQSGYKRGQATLPLAGARGYELMRRTMPT